MTRPADPARTHREYAQWLRSKASNPQLVEAARCALDDVAVVAEANAERGEWASSVPMEPSPAPARSNADVVREARSLEQVAEDCVLAVDEYIEMRSDRGIYLRNVVLNELEQVARDTELRIVALLEGMRDECDPCWMADEHQRQAFERAIARIQGGSDV